MGSCHFSCPAAILVSWEKAVPCSCPEIEENGEGENRKELGKNSRIALVSVNSCVDRMKPRFKRDLISKLCVEVRFWGYLLEGRFKKYFPVHSVNKHHVIESQSWAGRCFYFPAKFMQKSPINNALWYFCSQRWYLSTQSHLLCTQRTASVYETGSLKVSF